MDANTIGAIAAVVALPLAIIIAWITPRMRGRARRLNHEFVAGSYLLTRDVEHVGKGLEVRYNDRVVDNPYWLIVRIINPGPKAIDESDFRGPMEIELDRPIVLAEVAKTGREEMKKPVVTIRDNVASIPGMLFNNQDWLAVSILTEGEPVRRKVHVRAKDVEPSREFRLRTYGDWLDRLAMSIVGVVSLAFIIAGYMVSRSIWHAVARTVLLSNTYQLIVFLAIFGGVPLLTIFGGDVIYHRLSNLFQRWESSRQDYLKVD